MKEYLKMAKKSSKNSMVTKGSESTSIQIQAEKAKRKSGSKDVSVPRPINVKLEKHQKGNSTSSEDENDLVPAPIQVKAESRKRRASGYSNSSNSEKSDSNDSGNEAPGVPLPKIIKKEPQSVTNSSNSEESSSDGEERVSRKMEYLNTGSEKTPKTKNSWIKKIKSKHPNIEKQQIPVGLPDVDKYFLLRVPKTLDPTKLLNLPWDLNKNLKFRLLDRKAKYVIKQVKSTQSPRFVLGNEAKILCIDKVYSVSKHISKKRTLELEQAKPTTVALPENLKVRHPLFGARYEKSIKLRKYVRQRLKEATENLKKQSAKQIKKAKMKRLEDRADESSELIFDMLKSHTSRKLFD